jgi:ubiquinol-cytochrome c reductase iron-sulfur subunit
MANTTTISTGASSREPTRRDFLYIATAAMSAVGVGATLVPLIVQMNPDASTLASGGPIDIHFSDGIGQCQIA